MKKLVSESLVTALVLVFMCFTEVGRADNWAQWRGNDLDGISSETGLATQWDRETNIAWRLPLPGVAGASPIVWGERIFLTTVDGDDLLLICVGTDGREQWRETLGQGNRTVRRDEGNSASPSPCTDGEHVWAMMTDGVLFCYTVDGQKVWQKDLQQEYGTFKIQFGMTSSPVLDNGVLYLQLIHGDMRPFESTSDGQVIALDAKTGDERWKHQRQTDGRVECKHSYASPVIYRDDEQEFLLTHGADYVIGHSLSDGSEIWRCGGLNPKSNYNVTLRFVASPVCQPGLIVVPSAKGGPVLGLKPELKGDVTGQQDAYHWQLPRGTPDVPTPIIHDGLVYLCRENGVLICLDAKTGEKIYEERTIDDRHRASPVLADGKIFLTARRGVVTVVKAGRQFEVLAQNDMNEPTSASPAISNGRIYIRTFEALYAIEN